MFLDRTALAVTGPVVRRRVGARDPARPAAPAATACTACCITLAGGDKTPACTVEEDWRCDGGGYENYTLEVVDRMGSDSFTPDHGVLIAKNKTAELAPFKWVVDAHPEDIDKVDFIRADGTTAKVTKGDYRQLADALFHAGTGPGVVSEYVDEPNRLHFYVLANARDDEGVLSYRVAVRSLDGGGPGTRGVAAEARRPPARPRAGSRSRPSRSPTPARRGPHPDRRKDEGPLDDDAAHRVLDVPGETVEVPVYVKVPETRRGPPG